MMKYWQLKNLLRKVCATGSIDAGTAEEWRGGNPHRFEKGKGAIMIGIDPAAEEKSVARGLIIDLGGGASTYMYAGEGKIFYPKITGKWRRNNPGEGQGAPARGVFIQVHTAEIEQYPGGKNIKVHTAEEWRGGTLRVPKKHRF